MAKTASLTAGLVAKKGQAAPATVGMHLETEVATVSPDSPSAATPASGYYKALTVKLDRQRYENLKTAGLKLDKKSQEIFVEALDAYLAKLG